MTRDEMIERLAKFIESVEEPESDDLYFRPFLVEANEARWKLVAAAVLDLVGPKPLVWMNTPEAETFYSGRYTLILFDDGYLVDFDDRSLGHGYTLEAAQAAAQAHADAAHWANTRIGDA